ncbi:MAG: phytanoyl-CoA dioxygenase family protein [Ignavibacteriales bacterium]|nr:phytanoyl-CoA dioxygenase family protein [Ignavibacteriales bacterium]
METTQLRERYEQNGYYIHAASILSPELLVRATRGLEDVCEGMYDTGLEPAERLWNPGDDPRALRKIEQPHLANYALREAINAPLLGQLAAAITGAGRVQIWWVQLLYKPGTPDVETVEVKTSVGWHQDQAYWREWEDGSELFTAWLALSDVTVEAGPMVFVRGSHRWGLLNKGDFFGQDLNALQSTFSIPLGEQWSETTNVLPPGGVSFHHRLLIHGSRRNATAGPRRSLAIHLRTERSNPRPGSWVTRYLDQPTISPVIFQR